MYSHFLALPLPLHVQSRLASFCYGLPQVHWNEEQNFYLIVRHLGSLPDATMMNIREHLQHLFFQPFHLVLQGMGHFHNKGNQGTIWAGVAANHHLEKLRKEIDRDLRGIQLPYLNKNSLHPHIVLGHYQHINPERLNDYLAAHTDYQSPPIEITSCVLVRSFQTSKRMIYEIIEEYSASQLKEID